MDNQNLYHNSEQKDQKPVKPFGIDVSRWQGKINWDVVKANPEPVRFCAIRATINWGYVDSWFHRNWIEAKRVGIIRGAYHVMFPETSPEKQIDFFLSSIGKDLGELPLILDVELDHNRSRSQIETAILQCCTLIKSKTGRPPILYSRAAFIDYYVTGNNQPAAWLNEYDWWLAHYSTGAYEHPGPPPLPKGVIRERCIAHQTTSHGPGIGTESKMMDYNRWQFDLNHLENYSRGKIPFSLEEKINLLWEAHPELHKR